MTPPGVARPVRVSVRILGRTGGARSATAGVVGDGGGGPQTAVGRGEECLRTAGRRGTGGRGRIGDHVGVRDPPGARAARDDGHRVRGVRVQHPAHLQREARPTRLHTGDGYPRGQSDQGRALAGPDAHDAAHARGRASGSRPAPQGGRGRPGRPPRARPDAAHRRAAARGRRGRRGRGDGDVRRLPLVRPGPLRAERHLHPAVDLAPAVPGGRSRDGLADRTPPGHRLHPARGRLPARRRPERPGDHVLPGGGLPASRGDAAQPAPVSRLGADRLQRAARGCGLGARRR